MKGVDLFVRVVRLSGMLKRIAHAHTEDWHVARKRYVTASRSASLMLPDLPWALSDEDLAEDIKGGEWRPTAAMEAGTHFEFSNVNWLAGTLGCFHDEDGCLWADDELEGLAATPDHWIYTPHHHYSVKSRDHLMVHDTFGTCRRGDEAVTWLQGRIGVRMLVEAKQVRSKNRSKWYKPDPPDYYYNQVQHQMLVMGERQVFLFAKVDSYELYGYLVERDTEYCMRLKDVCQEFWRNYLL